MLKTSSIMTNKVLILLFLLIGLALANSNQTMAQTKTITGEWDAAMNTPGGVRNFKIVFKVEGEELTGTVKRPTGDVPLVGTVKGQDIQFSYTVKYNSNDLTISMTGKISGDSIAGIVFFGESGQQDDWSAKRVQSSQEQGR